MRPVSAPELLEVWERELGAPPFEQALAILSAASPTTTRETLARWCIGRRDDGLLRIREWAFGPNLAILAECPRCNEQLETTVPVESLRAPVQIAQNPEFTLTWSDYAVACRTPNSEDLAACQGQNHTECRQTLLRRCVIDSRCGNIPVGAQSLPAQTIDTIIARMAEADPQAQTLIDLTCPQCGYRWDEVFDIASFFWSEIDAWARRLLREVHVLASAYGWTEMDILPLSPTRRQIYLAMAQA